MSKATRYISSNRKEVTNVPNLELVPEKPPTWTVGYKIKKLTFMNHTTCTLIINGRDFIHLDEYRGFSMSYDDPAIESLVIVEEGTIYEMVCSY